MASPGSAKRITKELNDLMIHESEGIIINPIEDNIYDLEGVIIGPPDTPHEGGLFKFHIDVPKDYPFRPPKFRFTSKILR